MKTILEHLLTILVLICFTPLLILLAIGLFIIYIITGEKNIPTIKEY